MSLSVCMTWIRHTLPHKSHLLSLSLRSFVSLYLKRTREQVECESVHADVVVDLDQFV